MPLSILKKYKNSESYRIKFLLGFSIIYNVAYALYLLVESSLTASRWFFIMSVYYALLSIVRIFMFFQLERNNSLRKNLIIMRGIGCFLFLLNFIISIMMFVLIYTNKIVKHGEITVITLATYTFYVLAMAIIGSVKHIKRKNSLYSCIKIISLVSASVSMVTLTNTMLSTFGENNELLRSIILPLFSGVVSIFIIICAILMVLKANSNLRWLNYEEKRK